MQKLTFDSTVFPAVREESIQKLRIEISAMDAAQIRELITDDFVEMVENNFKILARGLKLKKNFAPQFNNYKLIKLI